MPYTRFSDLLRNDTPPSDWLENPFNLHFDEHMKKEYTLSNPNNCYFCKKNIKNKKHETIKIKGDTIHICNNCGYLYKTLKNEKESKNLRTVNEIISFINLYGDSNDT